MGNYDYIARGTESPERSLLSVAGLLENRRRYREQAAAAQEQQNYERGRTAAADKKQATEEETRHSLAKVEWALQSASPAQALKGDPQAVDNLGKHGIDVNSLDDASATKLLQDMRAGLASQLGEGPPERKPGGAPVKVKGPKGQPIYADPTAAIGQEAYNDPGADAHGSWSSPWKGVDPMTHVEGLWQTNSLTGENRPAKVGPNQLQPPADSGTVSVAPYNAIHRAALAFYGGEIDPNNGEFQILKTDAPQALELSSRASELYRQAGGKISPQEAVQRAAHGAQPAAEGPTRDGGSFARNVPIQPGAPQAAPAAAPQPQAQRAPAQAPQAGGLPPQAAAALKEGVVTTFANGQKWTLRGGQPVQVQ